MKKIDELKKIAKQVFEYENLLLKDKNNKSLQEKIENIIMSLSLEDMLFLDEIIQDKNF